ncbi:hypothetical protein HD806DRAFT_537756 [Xylariaceae sp. AK1471]|nr:hypothetical protein HD806DRAFT_537756 [Xylariaceae sp. AK1471]
MSGNVLYYFEGHQYHDLNSHHHQFQDTHSSPASDYPEDEMYPNQQQQSDHAPDHSHHWGQVQDQTQDQAQPQFEAWDETMLSQNQVQQQQQEQEYVKHLYQTENGTSWQEFPPQWEQVEQPQSQIVHLGDGMTIAGQHSEEFEDTSQVSLCYQCCKQISLGTLLGTRDESCGDNACRRTEEIGLQFIPMPEDAAEACEDFQTFLVWWMDKVELGVSESVVKLARARVQEMRDNIPDVNPVEW